MSVESQTYQLVLTSISAGRLRVSLHAFREAEADRLSFGEIEAASLAGECVEDYPDDPRGASCLILGRDAGGGALHALWGSMSPRSTLY